MATRSDLKQFATVELPAIIPCSQCRVPKPRTQYSLKRLADLQKAIISHQKKNEPFDPKKELFICCTKCLGGPAVEKKCYDCEITFPKTTKYFSKTGMRNLKHKALCWTCSERQQNETLSSDDEGSDAGSDESDTSFITNRFRDADLESTTSDTASASGIVDNSSGGVSLTGFNAPSAVHTVYAGSASSMLGSARGTITSPSVGRTSSALGSSTAGASPSVASSRAPASTGLPKGFDANKYGDPSRRSPTSSVASGSSSKAFPKVPAVPTYINSDAAREQQRDMKRRAATTSSFQDIQAAAADSDSSEGSGPTKSGPSSHGADKRADAKGPPRGRGE